MLSIANKIIKEMLIINPKTFAIFLGLLVFASCSDAPNEADLILSSSNVILMNADKDAEPLSIAIADKEIVWIGSIKEGKKIQGKHLDYGDQSILPGFIDAHGHASFVAFSTQVANIASKPVGPVNAIENIQSELREFINKENLKPGEWVIGMGYDDSLLEEQRHPTREDLDAVSTINPIYLIHVSGHLGASNTLGLSLANITAESQDPPGGKGEPTTDPDWADLSISYLDQMVIDNGPFYALIGYSQGSAMIPVYLANTQNTFDRVMLYNGYLPTTHHGLMDTIDNAAPFSTPAMIFSGENDGAFKDLAPALAQKFTGSLAVSYTHLTLPTNREV